MLGFLKKNKKLKEVKSNKKEPLKKKLFKSRNIFGDGISSILLGKKNINDEILQELETILITADVGIDTTDKILESVRKKASRKEIKEQNSIYNLLKEELESLLVKENELIINSNKTFVILVVGVNGVGKTTTIGKLAKSLQNQNKSVMLAAGDTFRAAAIEQLKIWGERNNIPVIYQNTGSDSASVIYDAYQSAKANNIDVLIADTAGRMHTQNNLMQELEKIKRVLKKHSIDTPQETMLVIDGSSGQNSIRQAEEFNKIIGISGISITKLDGTAKGGIVFAISDALKLPIRYIGVGENIQDLRVFNNKDFIAALFD